MGTTETVDAVNLPIVPTDEEVEIRAAVRGICERLGGPDYHRRIVAADEPPTELWNALAEKGYLGVNLPERYGGGGLGMHALQMVGEEISAAGCSLLLIVVSPAIVGSIITRHGTEASARSRLRARSLATACRAAQAPRALAVAGPRRRQSALVPNVLARPSARVRSCAAACWDHHHLVELVDPTVLPVEVRTAIDGRDGVVAVRCAAAAGELEVTVGGVAERLPAGGGTVRVPAPDLWWPHTHGEPVLHGLHVRSKAGEAQRNVGFRQLTHADNVELDGLDLHVNGVPVFVRGAVWTPTPPGDVRATLERACGAGLNLIRIVGTMVYEDAAFHDACDELGLFVWQDSLFANMDYPFSDEGFAALAEKEVSQALDEVAGRPSLAVVCGNSEIEQQVAMLGLPPELGRDPFFLSKIPALIRSAQLDAAYVPSAPTGGAFPFRTGQGVANYFGVGAYLRPLEDVRRSAVRFASECLAFANVPDGDPLGPGSRSDAGRRRRLGLRRCARPLPAGAAWDHLDG